ncbi:MAG: prepilin peptidase [Lachnospiraceae bacterium]|nr:prepilin peptidase [Lachnospiraceae bacterium]
MPIERNIIIGIAFIIVCICAIYDVKKKEIPFVGIILGGFMGVAINLWQIAGGYLSFVEIGLAVLPGCFFLLVGFVTGQKVGYGDGLLLVVIGLFTGFNRCALILCISLVLLSVSALVLLCIRKVGKNSKIPFVPFLAVGMGVGFWV